MRGPRTGLIAAAALIALAVAASPAHAAGTRAEYVAQVDPICHTGDSQHRSAFKAYAKSVKRYLKHHPQHPRQDDAYKPSKTIIRMVVRYYTRGLQIERGVNSQLASISPVPGDEAAIGEWLRLRTGSADLLERTIHAFHQSKIKFGLHLYVKSIHKSLMAQLPISDFGFHYCASDQLDL